MTVKSLLLSVAPLVCTSGASLILKTIGLNLPPEEKERWSWVVYLAGQKPRRMINIAGLLMSAAVVFTLLNNYRTEPAPTQTADGQRFTIAPNSAIVKELPTAREKAEHDAVAFGEAGDRHFKAGRYAEAAANYAKSVEALPTAAGLLNYGISLRVTGNLAAAGQPLEAGLAIARENHDAPLERALLLNLAVVQRERGELPSSLRWANEALDQARAGNDKRDEAAALGNIAGYEDQANQFAAAMDHYREALAIYKDLNDLEGQASVHVGMGAAQGRRSMNREALDSFTKAERLYAEGGNTFSQSRLLTNLAQMTYSLGDKLTAQQYVKEAIRVARRGRHVSQEATATAIDANILQDTGDLPAAIEAGQKAVTLFREAGEIPALAMSLARLGQTFIVAKDLNQAEVNLREALKLVEAHGLSARMTPIMGALAGAWMRMERYDEAEPLLIKARDRFADETNAVGRATCLVNLGYIKERRREFKSALEDYREAVPLLDQQPLTQADAHYGAGSVLYKTNDLAGAIVELNAAVTLYRKLAVTTPNSEAAEKLLEKIKAIIERRIARESDAGVTQ